MKTLPHIARRLVTTGRNLRPRQVIGLLIGLIGFAAAVATLEVPLRKWLFPKELTVYVLHPYATPESDAWTHFDTGLDSFLAESGAGLGTTALELGEYELRFERKTWKDEQGLRQQVDDLMADDRALAVIAATSSNDSQYLVHRVREEGGPPVLLAIATRDDLLGHSAVHRYEAPEVPRVFRMVPNNGAQAEGLASVVLTPKLASCNGRPSETTSVVILREEADNATFSRDLAESLLEELEAHAQRVDVLVNAVADDILILPRELVDLEPDFLVYIGSQKKAATFYRQLVGLDRSSGSDGCLPKLVLTDGGIIGEGSAGDWGGGEERYATLPLARETPIPDAPASYYTLGRDSGELLVEAAQEARQRPSGALDWETLAAALSRSEEPFSGEAQRYAFDRSGENQAAEFHLWGVADDEWRHLEVSCSADSHPERSYPSARAATEVQQASIGRRESAEAIRVGAKPFAEQRILAAVAVEALLDAGIRAERGQESLNGINSLLLLDRIDAYWEYTGTALHRYHGIDGLRGDEAIEELRRLDGRIEWLSPLRIDNSFVLMTTPGFARRTGVRTIGELAAHVNDGNGAELCAPPGWFDFQDGLQGLSEHYGVSWPQEHLQPVPMELIHDRLGADCDVSVAAATDGQLHRSKAVILEDEREFFPEYRPALAFREEVYQRLEEEHPTALARLEERLRCVRNSLGQERMRELNSWVTFGDLKPAEVASRFLRQECPARVEPPSGRV